MAHGPLLSNSVAVHPLFVNKVFIQEGQVALNRSHEFCLKLKYRNLLKADHVPGDTWGGAFFGPNGII